MASSEKSVYMHGLKDSERGISPKRFTVPAKVKDMCCHGNYVFLALEDGSVMKHGKRRGETASLL